MNWWSTAIESFFVGAFGAAATVFGLSKFLGDWWLKRQEARYSRELEAFRDTLQKEQKRVQAQIDRSVFVTRAHFETEFAAMKDVFKRLAEVRLLFNALRPSFSVELEDEDKTEKLERLFERLRDLQSAHDDFLSTFETLSPFYPRDLYAGLQECARQSSWEIHDVLAANEAIFTQDWYRDGRTNRASFETSYQAVATIIRERIEKLAILPSN
jgi:hypothetical protein